MKIYVTRHGQTDWNVQGKTQGRADIELNESLGVVYRDVASTGKIVVIGRP